MEYLPQGAATLAPIDALSVEVERQINAYVRNAHFRWDLPYDLQGTVFQCRVWTQIQDIPCGQVRRYGDIAKSIQTSARAVGTCCGANHLPLIIPCHRVVAASGIGGFMHTWQEGAALRVKRWLLQHEGVTL